MPQRFRMGNPHTDREIDALWREIHRAQRRVQVAEVQVAAAAEPSPEPPVPDDFSDTQVLIEGGPCRWPTRCYLSPVWNFNETDMTSQFTHPAQWAVWNDYREDLYRWIILDLHRIHPFYNPGDGAKHWREETGSPSPWQPIWQETVDGDSYEVLRGHANYRNSIVMLWGTEGSLWVRAFCYRNRRWMGYLNGFQAGGISLSQQYEIRSDINNPIPLTCADIPAVINVSVDPNPWAHRLWLTSNVAWIPGVNVTSILASLYLPETAVAA
jgi:hypothetical protein